MASNGGITSGLVVNHTRSNYFVHFTYQANDVQFADWISLITVCLAPLVAHLVSGTPRTVYLHNVRPKWHDKIVHYNPTAILWRYFAITDRRIRARNWNHSDMAAGNALFWTARGWDGSEEMMIRSREFRIQAVPTGWSRVLSTDTAKTIIVSLQGAQALYLLVFDSLFGSDFALDSIFTPIAIFGLLRLCAAFWLTDELLFANREDDQRTVMSGPSDDERTSDLDPIKTGPPHVFEVTEPERPGATHFHPANGIRGLPMRLFTMVFLLGGLATCLLLIIPHPHGGYLAVTSVLMFIFYAMFLTISVGSYATYFITHRSSSSTTVIPCITALWFKIYTGVLGASMIALIIVSALETRQTPCGSYSTYDGALDYLLCPGLLFANGTVTAQG